MHGFKSFADPVNIEFQDGITCIVGPNGSGKSNISDAIRWVLGEQSAKTLRGGKMEEVIFSGSASRRPKGMAEVTLTIDNSTGILPIDYSEVAIRRRVFRSGESEYSINGSQCRRRDIVELIMDTGIGVDGYSLIGQGKISDIISEKPESRREIFEEAAGIIKYKSQKEAAQRKLENANINLDRANDIIAEMEERLPGLKIESAKAKEAAELKERHKALEINITLRNIESIQKKNEILREDLSGESQRLNKLRSEKVRLETDISSMRKQDEDLGDKSMTTKDRIQNNISETKDLINNANLNEERQKSLERDKERLKVEIDSLREKIKNEQERADSHKKDKSEVDEKVKSLEEKLNQKTAEAADHAAQLVFLTDKLDEKKNTVFELTSEKSNKQTEIKANEDLMSNYDSTKNRVNEEVEESQKIIEGLKAELNEKTKELDSFTKNISELEQKRETLEKQHENASISISESKNLSEQLKLDIEKLSSRKKTIEEMESNYEGYNFGVRSLMKQGMPGVEGVVAELMTVPKGYETAIETALGAAMQNIVTRDDSSAKKCINYLKDNNAGRLTFLPADSIRDRRVSEDKKIIEETGYDGYAVDKIEFDSKYNAVFGYLLGNVVIIDTLDNAVRISKKTKSVAKFVTLDGDLINAGGAITGGKFKNKSANLLERRGEIESLTEEISGKEKRREQELKKMKSLSEETESFVRDLQQVTFDIREIEDKKIAADSDAISLKNRITENQERLSRKQQEYSSIDTRKEEHIGMNDSIRGRLQEIDKEITVLEGEIESDSETLSKMKEASENINAEVTQIKMKAAEAGKEKETKDSIIQSIIMNLNGFKADLELKLTEQESINGEESKILQEADLKEMVRTLEEEKKTLDDNLEKINGDRQELRVKIEESELKLRNSEREIETASEGKHGMEIEMGKQETRLTNLKDKLYDDFDITYVEATEFRNEDFIMSNAVKENRVIKKRLSEIGEVNPGSIKEYEELNERYEFQTEQRDDILKSINDYERIVIDMDKTSKVKFKESFDKIVENFDETFKLMFGGGKGRLIMENPDDPLESGIEISAQPPGKVIKNINQMSGGEQTMVAIALMFSVLKAKPTPFCILDEVEAALDENNIRRFCDYLVNFREIQFALVTHQKTTMEYADVLYGVTMPEQGITKVLSLRLGDAKTDEFANQLEN